ncbi:hypothetical protein LO771_19330 [Streptacidiphilus sp. ASG 303]|uniref:hypothetical protein n=1 Tax=Streptacidiphilus sp. ASG 303 TaxID=2896847 RepID=UPI001E415CBC|nr:hypothetical protein [Streptacidiphilus sp. ASG 303]MCD0484490.1 hypothetical protein [Streptacidiphilus sp. ASG 303]
MRTIRTAAVAAAACVLLGGLSACGGEKKDERTPADALKAASAVMAKAGSAAFTLDAQDPEDGKSTAKGAMSWTGAKAMDLAFTSEDGPARMRWVGTTLYFGGDDKDAADHDGKHWMKLGGGPATAGADTGQMGAWVDQANPSSALDAVVAVGTLRKVGEEKVAAADTVHYQGTAPVADLVAATRQLSAKQRKSTLEMYRKQGATSVTLDFWLNGDDEVVRHVQTAKGTKGTSTTAFVYSELGRHAGIQAPPASDVYSLEDMMKQAAGALKDEGSGS